MRKVNVLKLQLNEAVREVQLEADQRSDFGRGEYAGAAAVMVKLAAIQRHDTELAEENIARGAP